MYSINTTKQYVYENYVFLKQNIVHLNNLLISFIPLLNIKVAVSIVSIGT